MSSWGLIGAVEGLRYLEPVEKTSRRHCRCGCNRRATHKGMNNGVCLTMACELAASRWLKTGRTRAI